MKTKRRLQRLCIFLIYGAATVPAAAEKPEILKAPDSVFRIHNSGDFGLYGSELRSDFVFPLDSVAKMHPLAKDKTIVRITRTGGWSRASFLIVPQQRAKAYLVYWNTSRWNLDMDVREVIFRTKWVEDSDAFDDIMTAPILVAPQEVGELRKGQDGDDFPFLLVERLNDGRYEGVVVSPSLYHGEIQKQAETILTSLEKCFTDPTARGKPEKSK